MPPRAKRAKLADGGVDVHRLLHVGAVSTTGLIEVLRRLRREDLAVSTKRVYEANREAFLRVRHVLQVPLLAGGLMPWEFASPAKLLGELVSADVQLENVFAEAVARAQPSLERPWALVVAFDEFAPGNKLRFDNRRKTMVLSFSFVQLGQEALACGRFWVTPVCVRTTSISAVSGGWSAMLKLFLDELLFGAHGLATAGIPLVLHGRHVLIFARLANVLADGDGLRTPGHSQRLHRCGCLSHMVLVCRQAFPY